MKRDELRKDGFLAVPDWLLRRTDLSPAQKLVAAVIIDHLGQANDEAWPGPSGVAKQVGLTVRGVKNAIRELKRAGILSPGGIAANRYGTRCYSVTSEIHDRVIDLPGHRITPSPGHEFTPSPVNGFHPKQGSNKQGSKSMESGPAALGGHSPASFAETPSPAQINPTSPSPAETHPVIPASPVEPALHDPALAAQGKHDRVPASLAEAQQAPAESTAPADTMAVSTLTDATAGKGGRPAHVQKGESKHKPAPMTLDEEKYACSSLSKMTDYLLYGVAGLRLPAGAGVVERAALPLVAGNWRKPGRTPQNVRANEWTTLEFASYWWWCVCWWRSARGLTLDMPDFGRLCKSIKALQERGVAGLRLYLYFRNTERFWDLIQYRIGGRLGAELMPGNGSLDHKLISEHAAWVERATDADIQNEYARMAADTRWKTPFPIIEASAPAAPAPRLDLEPRPYRPATIRRPPTPAPSMATPAPAPLLTPDFDTADHLFAEAG